MSVNEIWVIAETRNNQLTRTTSQLVEAAKSLGENKGLTPVGILLGSDRPAAEALAAKIETVMWLNDDALAEYDAALYAHALENLVSDHGAPVAVLGSASSRGGEIMPRLAAACKAGFAGSCTDLRWQDDMLVAKRPVFGGKVYEELAFSRKPAVFTVRPGAFTAAEDHGAKVEVDPIDRGIDAPRTSLLLDRQTTSGGVDLMDAARVVAGGRGMSGEAFVYVEQLADSLEGAAAASRALVDAGEKPHDQQVGKSGKTVSPELYIACGISGAIHHVLGMNTAKVVVAVNSDPDAAIFSAADYGIVGDGKKILQDLGRAIRDLKG